ncbi:flavin monoamine oxidase family protein [Peribacillus kribbensis]|uniref:flavin monoamine oxidase family protein n=1 Tax=Peribacillus kribbensis TaxID=356658 RepID=UPI0004252417|nr:flavin monoamine oxidase family protein [Peribacillus kribbensis]
MFDIYTKEARERVLSLIRHGLPNTNSPKKISIIGAGMSGLVAGSLLKASGHHVTILEASDRVGGKIYTARKPFENGQYLDMGAMRIPDVHFMTLAYIEKFGLKINRFIGTTPNDLVYVNGKTARLKEVLKSPGILGFPLLEAEQKISPLQLFQTAIRPITEFIARNPAQNWPKVVRDFDSYSFEAFLKYNPAALSLSDGAINMLEVLLALEGFPELSFTAVLRELLYLLESGLVLHEITGGNDLLPHAFLKELQSIIMLNQRVEGLTQSNDEIVLRSTAGKNAKTFITKSDLVIITVPFSAFPFINVNPRSLLSYHKWRAINELHYITGTKIGLQFSRRFWEENGQYGGQSITDLPVRFSYYPSRGIGTNTPGIVLASYTWGDDSLFWDSLDEKDRIHKSLENLSIIHGRDLSRYFMAGKSFSWGQNPYSAGVVSFYKPLQQTTLGPYIASREGRVLFAGEHTSNYPGWIQGAIESGIRVAEEVNQLVFLHNE